jgi:hypothetical protein
MPISPFLSLFRSIDRVGRKKERKKERKKRLATVSVCAPLSLYNTIHTEKKKKRKKKEAMSASRVSEPPSPAGGASLPSPAAPDANRRRVSYFYEPTIGDYYYGQGHPMKPHRIRMAHCLVVHYRLHRFMEVLFSVALPFSFPFSLASFPYQNNKKMAISLLTGASFIQLLFRSVCLCLCLLLLRFAFDAWYLPPEACHFTKFVLQNVL